MVLREKFNHIGKIVDVYIPLGHYDKKPQGYGFIEFDSAKDAEYAVRKMDGCRVDGNVLTLQVAQDRRKNRDAYQNNRDDRDKNENEGGKKGNGKYGNQLHSKGDFRGRKGSAQSVSASKYQLESEDEGDNKNGGASHSKNDNAGGEYMQAESKNAADEKLEPGADPFAMDN